MGANEKVAATFHGLHAYNDDTGTCPTRNTTGRLRCRLDTDHPTAGHVFAAADPDDRHTDTEDPR